MRAEALPADVPGDLRAVGDPTRHYGDDEPVHRPGQAAHAIGGDYAGHHAGGATAGYALLMTVPLYLWNFAPHPFKPGPNDPKVMWVPDLLLFAMLLVLELLGAIIKAFALSIRLFAHLIAGPIVLAVPAGPILPAPP